MRKTFMLYSLALASVLGASAKIPSAPTHDGETIEEADSVKRAKLRSSKTRTTENCVRKGIVVDAETGEPIIGASVFVKGTREGTVTNSRGEYTCQCPKGNEHIVISFVGKKSREVTAGDNLKILLYDDETQLKDVVVVAYGTQQKRNLTSSVASVTAKTLTESPVTSLEQALEGKMAGVQVTPATGAPGGAVVVNIRGTSSISAGNEPLYVVDGLPILSQDISQKGGYQGNSLSGIADINPNDIESVEVLKDASASALYGSRASNGVVLITTKQGRRGRTRVTLDSYIGFQDLWKSVDLLDANSHVAAYNEAIDNYNTSLGLSAADAAYKQHITANDAGADTDWLDAVTRTALQTSHQLSISGGNDRTLFYVSGGFYDQQGVIQKTEFKRYNLRTNLTHQLTSKLRIDANIALSSSDNTRSTGDGNIYSPWVNALKAGPDYAIYAADGSYNSVNSALYNPLELIDGQEQTSKKYRAIVNLKGEWKILPFLTYRIGLDGDYNIMHERGYFPATSIQGATSKGEVTDYRGFSFTQLIEHTLDFKKKFGELDLGVLAGYSYQKTKIDNAYVGGINFLSPSLKYITSAGEINTGSSSLSEYALQSFFGRVNLSYAERYLLELSLRSDASSKFSPSKRVGYFPAASAGWRISDESWFGKSDVVSDLKLRLGYGITGQQEINQGDYPYMAQYTIAQDHAYYPIGGEDSQLIDDFGNVVTDAEGNVLYTSFRPNAYNSELTWEKTTTYNAGIDYGFLNGRVTGAIDYYFRQTDDLLNVVPVAVGTNFRNKVISNVGTLTNQGVEFSINAVAIDRKNFKWDLGFNVTYNENKITKLNTGEAQTPIPTGGISCGTGNTIQRHAVGYAASSFYVYETAVGTRDNGEKFYYVVDRNEDGTISEEDQYYYHSPNAPVTMGFQTKFQFFGFDLGISLRSNIGNYVYNDVLATNLQYCQSENLYRNGYHNLLLTAFDTYYNKGMKSDGVYKSAEGTDKFTEWYRLDYFVENGSFLRIDNITLGYSFQKPKISGRVYLTVQNPCVISKYSGLDPEVFGGIDNNIYPRSMTSLVGLSLQF